MKILQLVAYYSPERIASAHLSKDREEAFAAAGFTTELYAPTPTRGLSEEEYKEYKKVKQEKRYDGKLTINRFSMFREGKNPLLRAARYFLVNIGHYIKGTSVKDADVILCGSTPPTQGMLCGLIKKRLSRKAKRNIPFVFILQDIFPDSLVNAKMTKKGSLIWKIGRKIENYAYRSADRIIVISEDFKRNIMEKGVPEERIAVIPNWVNTDKVYPVKREDNILFERYHLDPSLFYICYSGNIGHSQNMDMLLDSAKALAEELPELRFVLVGEGAARDEVEARIIQENIENVIMLPFQPYEEISHVFSLGDAGLIISKAGIGGSSVPSKTWSIMAANRPVLASFDKESQLGSLIAEAQCGLVAQANDSEAFKEAVRKLYQNRDNASVMGERGREYLAKNLDKETCVNAYVNVLRQVTENGGKTL
ncbi:MAG: glycosyltransferase family 4 protein [Clostridiales bacterium]|nr:glycosyltransferase family 4 protein [Clostridiales bacterium]